VSELPGNFNWVVRRKQSTSLPHAFLVIVSVIVVVIGLSQSPTADHDHDRDHDPGGANRCTGGCPLGMPVAHRTLGLLDARGDLCTDLYLDLDQDARCKHLLLHLLAKLYMSLRFLDTVHVKVQV
jgi:hypothetical protein